MSWIEIAKLAAYFVAGVFVMICNVIITKRKPKDADKKENEPLSIPSAIKDYIIVAMEEAEETGLKGVMKKSYALSLIILKCVSSGIDYNAIEGLVSDYIEELVTLTKKVN